MMQFSEFVRKIASRIFSRRLYSRMQVAWNLSKSRKLVRQREWIMELLVATYGRRVIQGPFAGMKYISNASGSELIPKLIGTYESELHGIIDQIIAKRYNRMIDVGCAEGYYAVGFAYRCPWLTVEAFDIDQQARDRCEEMSRLNGVQDRVTINGEFSADSLLTGDDTRTVILCDCEGAEMGLFGTSPAAKWQHCDILIELHDFLNPDITPTILKNMSATHDIQLIDSLVPDPSRVPTIWFLRRPSDRWNAVTEQRVPMQWAWITRRTSL